MAESMEVRDTREWRGVAKVACTWDSVRFLARQGFGPHPRRRVSWGVGPISSAGSYGSRYNVLTSHPYAYLSDRLMQATE